MPCPYRSAFSERGNPYQRKAMDKQANTLPFKKPNPVTALLPNVKPLIRKPAVLAATGYSSTTLYRQIKKGLFTKSVEIGGERVAWPLSEVAAINQARIAGKSDDEIKQLVIDLEAERRA
jgi:prophage regulatory protein